MSGIGNALAGGAVVVLGVVLAEWLQRARTRRDQIRASTLELIILVPHVVAGMTAGGTGTDTSAGSPWSQRRERALTLLTLIETNSNRRGRRNRKIREAADDLSARLAAAEMDLLLKGIRLPMLAAIEITPVDLRALVLGDREPLDQQIESYRQGRARPVTADAQQREDS